MNNELATLNAKTLKTVDSVVGFSYDALSGPYVTPQDVMTQNPILRRGEIAIERKKEMTSDTYCLAGDSLLEMAQALNATVGASAKYLMFSGALSTEFTKQEASVSETAYLKLMNITTRTREYFSEGNVYRDHLDPNFVKDLQTLFPDDLFRKYGTHLITEACFGGRLELNFTYRKDQNESTSSVKASVEASFADFATKASTQYSDQTKRLVERSEMSIRCVGGSSTGISSINAFSEQYMIWAKSLDTEANCDFCFVPNNSSLMPLWELCEDEGRRKTIEDRYIALANDNAIALTENDLYVTDVTFVAADKQHKAEISCPSGYILVKKDLNAKAGGKYIYLCYKLGAKKDAVTNCFITAPSSKAGGDGNEQTSHDGKACRYVRNGTDLNAGSGGKYIYFHHTTESDTKAVKRIDVIFDGESLPAGWEAVCWQNSTEPADCNKSVGGRYIYIIIKR